MAEVVIQVEGLGKKYRLGNIGTGTLSRDLNQWWAKIRGKEDPYSSLDPEDGAAFDQDEFWALQNVGFEVQQGDAIGIIGKNGAGKSTLLKILSRVTAPTYGEVRVDGRIASLLEVGTGFHPELTGRENIFLNGAILGMTKREIRSKLDEIIAFSGVERHIDTPVKRYSSGMYVRLAFAVAAHLEPEILIVDEVLAVGDAEFQKKCLGKMNQVAGEGRTVLFVSHNMAAVKNLCNKGILLNGGKVHFNGTAEKAIATYIDLTTRNSSAEAVWENLKEAPGGEDVRILAVRIISGNGLVSGTIPIDEDFYVEVVYLNQKDGHYLTSNILLLDRGGLGVLSTGNWSSATANIDHYSGTRFKKGIYRSRVKIKGNFLNAGVFHISAVILKDACVELAYAREVISFEVIDTGEMSKEYADEWLGVVRPKLEWETSAVQNG